MVVEEIGQVSVHLLEDNLPLLKVRSTVSFLTFISLCFSLVSFLLCIHVPMCPLTTVHIHVTTCYLHSLNTCIYNPHVHVSGIYLRNIM